MQDTITKTPKLEDSRILYEDDEHQYIWFGWEEEEGTESFVQTNQCLILNHDQGYFFDPGGTYVFHHVLENIARYVNPRQLRYIIATHQDPDVCSSIPYWMKATDAELLISRLWLHFVSHFGLEDVSRVLPVPDGGVRIKLNSGDELLMIPAHFLHSEGNFCIYDSRSQILFSGDIGAAIFPHGERYLFVEDFQQHLHYCAGFHKRYMHSNRLCRMWAERVAKLPIRMIVPQHGAIYAGEQVGQFLSWFRDLKCGGDYAEQIYANERF
ncbi:Metallo-beta-lactamase superfamily protein [Allopseudospirillum japonicum]|uniref:Metallo-beta-lactamase superfamily protein n=1 Tax=Allopseudospirillum japonicum TaxID=64971 RepID=A0A1H6R0F1_9GAMM|nr:MBL fold metallo-hydrolase [Allopseudospirillum japonicum]SEI45025.1 Metallo-beta-lactamase superfamily protein [Allopseudospirillum japonicum]